MAEKTFSMVYRDTKKEIVDIINQSKLPADALLSIMESLTFELKAQADAAYLNDLKLHREAETKTKDANE